MSWKNKRRKNEAKRNNRTEKTEERMRHRDSVQRSDILLIVISEREKRKNGVEALSGKIIDNILNR